MSKSEMAVKLFMPKSELEEVVVMLFMPKSEMTKAIYVKI